MKLLRTVTGTLRHVRSTVFLILRYTENWSSYYAMAVIDLGQAVAREMPSKP